LLKRSRVSVTRSAPWRATSPMAVASASYWLPDLMIVDVGLGEASGVAAVKEILQSRFVRHVFVTDHAVRGIPLGPDTVLIQKPFRVVGSGASDSSGARNGAGL